MTAWLSKEYLQLSYREEIAFLKASKGLMKLIGLKRIPNYTTLIKFNSKIPVEWIEKQFKLFSKKNIKNLGVDSSGMSLVKGDFWYQMRLFERLAFKF